MAGYARLKTADIQSGQVVKSAPINAELNGIVSAFAFSGGHDHSGSDASTSGAFVPLIADVDALNKVAIDTTNNRVGFFTEVSSAAVEQVRIQDGAIVPVTDSDIDLGTASLEFKDLYIDGTAHIDTLDVDANATIAGTLDVTGAIGLSGAISFADGSASAPSITNTGDTNCGLFFSGADVLSFTAGGTAQFTMADGAIAPVTDNDVDLGTSSLEFKDLFLDGTAHIDTLDVDANATVAGTLAVTGIATFTDDIIIGDGKTIGSSSDADAMTIASNGQITLTQTLIGTALDISGDIDVDGTTNLDAVDIDGAVQADATVTVGVNDTGYDVKFFGDTASAFMLWDASADDLILSGDAGLVVPDGQFTLGSTAVTSTAAELNALDGITAVVGELNALDIGSTAVGTAVASKAVILDSNKDYTGIRNFEITGNLTVGGTQTVVNTVTMNAANALVFEGATADDHETTLTIVDPTADRTINLPNQSGTIALLAAASNTAITSTPAELNILDGVTSTAAELNILDGVTSTAAEINIIDGDTSATSTTLVDADRFVVNDAGTMKQVALTDLQTYVGQNIVLTGAMNSGSITSGFGSIDNGSSAITTTGTVTYGSLSDGTITITAFVDEDNMASNSATLVPTQQSVKAYVDDNRNVTGLTATGAEINVVADGDTSVGTTTVAGGDGIPTNDSGTMRLTSVDTFDTYFAGTTKTLTNKTLTSPVLTAPKIVDGGFIADANGNEIIIFQTASSATNSLEITNSANGAAVVIGAAGSSDSNIDIDISPKGTGEVNIAAGNLNYGSTAITSTGAELNLVDGSSAGTIVNSKAVIYSSGGVVNATGLAIAGTALNATAAEFNILDGGTSATGGTLADADRIIVNDNGTMVQEALSSLKTYLTPLIQEEATALAIALG
ncbi:hypothetical protein N9926_01165 [Flavobacteriaceae bacterium]|nr:hypothetical protein [Flavobacteriaceae bacterium]